MFINMIRMVNNTEFEFTLEEKYIVMDYVASRLIPVHTLNNEEITSVGKNAQQYIHNQNNQSFNSLNKCEQGFYEVLVLSVKKNQQTSILGILTTDEQKKLAIKVLIDISKAFSYHNAKQYQDPYWYRSEILQEYEKSELHIIRKFPHPIFTMNPECATSELELVLAHTYFATLHNENREITKARIIQELKRLYYDPITHHVIAILGYFMLKNVGMLIFADSYSVAKEAIAYFSPRDRLIYCGKIYEHNSERLYGDLIIHEALHFIMDTIYDNKSLPFFAGDTHAHQELLNHVRDLSQRLKNPGITNDEFKVWRVMQGLNGYIEQNHSRITNTEILLKEAIVRPMECFAAGYAPSAVNKLAPGVWSFYQNHCLPTIENCLEEHRKKCATAEVYQIYPDKKIKFALVSRTDTSGQYTPTPPPPRFNRPFPLTNRQLLIWGLAFCLVMPLFAIKSLQFFALFLIFLLLFAFIYTVVSSPILNRPRFFVPRHPTTHLSDFLENKTDTDNNMRMTNYPLTQI